MSERPSAPLTLAYSPCPNDTYIFAALAKGWLANAPPVRVKLDDVEALNRAALSGTYELTKVSYGAIPELMAGYRILRAGGALGHGCGPLVLARPGGAGSLQDYRDATIAIPGRRTTAFLLLRLALGATPRTVEMRFDQIVDAVRAAEVDAGLVIHETRFTYEDAGLVEIADLGAWWEETTGLPVPLGAILARNDLSGDQVCAAEAAIRGSLRFAREHEPQVFDYVRREATELSLEVMRKHVALYVNEFSLDITDVGEAAVRELFGRARAARLIEAQEPLFA